MSFKVIDSSGTINETISLEIAKCVGVWREMVGSEHSKDDDTPVSSLQFTLSDSLLGLFG
jgi:hypothetical protein